MKRSLIALPVLVALLACEPAPRNQEPGSYPQSGTVQVSKDGRFVYILSKDHESVLVYDKDLKETVRQIKVGVAPSALALLPNGKLVVANQGSDSISIVNPESGLEENQIHVGTEPSAVVAKDNKVFVALSGADKVAEVDVSRGEVVRNMDLKDGEPSGLALVSGDRLYVSHFLSDKISVLDLNNATTLTQVSVKMPSNPLLRANQLASLTVAPNEDEVSVPHQEANNDPGGFTNGTSGAGTAYYVDGPSGMPAVVPAVATLDPRTNQPTSDTEPPTSFTCAGCVGGTGAAPVAKDQNKARPAPAVHNVFDLTTFGDSKMNAPVAVAYVDGGRGKLVLYRGSNNVLLMRTTVVGNQEAVIAEYPVGFGADGMALSPDGKTAYVYAQFDHEIYELSVPRIDDAVQNNGLAAPGSRSVARTSVADKVRTPAHVQTVGSTANIPANVEAGRRLFFGATDPKLTRKGAVSCQSCHPNGRADGMTWTFGTEQFRNTPQLGGGIGSTAPFHWDGNRPTKADMNMTVNAFMGGVGLDPDQLDDLWAFLDTIPKTRSAVADQVDLQDSVQRGSTLFYSAETQCTSCHSPGNKFTDNLAWAVGTSDRELGLMVGTPVLAGLARSGPYMHDGRAKTLDELVNNYVRTDKMGKGAHLTDQQATDLVNFLKTL